MRRRDGAEKASAGRRNGRPVRRECPGSGRTDLAPLEVGNWKNSGRALEQWVRSSLRGGRAVAVIAPGTAFAAPFRNALVERLGESKFGLWFDQSARVETADDGVVITVPSRFHADWIDRHFRADVEAACAAAGLAGALRVEVDAAAFARPASSAA